MKKSDIEKQMLANRLRKKINEKCIISDGQNRYSLNEGELKQMISEAVKNVFNKKIND